jgi:hypothetical protein
MSLGGRSRGGVEQEGRSDGAAAARGAARKAPVDVPDRMNELTDGTVGSVDAVTEAAIGPYRKSRFNLPWTGSN